MGTVYYRVHIIWSLYYILNGIIAGLGLKSEMNRKVLILKKNLAEVVQSNSLHMRPATRSDL